MIASCLRRLLRSPPANFSAPAAFKKNDTRCHRADVRRTRFFQVASGNHGGFQDQVERTLPRPARPRPRRSPCSPGLAAVRGEESGAVGGRSPLDELQLEKRRALDQVLTRLGRRCRAAGRVSDRSPVARSRARRLRIRRSGFGSSRPPGRRVVLDLPAREILQREDPLAAGRREAPVGQEALGASSSLRSSVCGVTPTVNDCSPGNSTAPSVTPVRRACVWRCSAASSRSALTARSC